MPTAYCGMCHWEHQTDEASTTELDRAMIDHHVETGHSPIERTDFVAAKRSERADPTPTIADDRSSGQAEPDLEPKSDTEPEPEPEIELDED